MAADSDVVRLIAGPFHYAVAALWPGDRMSDYLLAPAARRHVWHAWLSARDEAGIADPESAGRRLMSASARELLAEAYGRVPLGLARALGRLGPLAQPQRTYR